MDFDTAQQRWTDFIDSLYDAASVAFSKLEEFGRDVIEHAERYYNDITE